MSILSELLGKQFLAEPNVIVPSCKYVWSSGVYSIVFISINVLYIIIL
jgi:hypothetical protein